MIHFTIYIKLPHFSTHLNINGTHCTLGSECKLKEKKIILNLICLFKKMKYDDYSCFFADITTGYYIATRPHFTDCTTHTAKLNIFFQIYTSIFLFYELKNFSTKININL